MYKVMIVEDDPMVASINQQYLERNQNLKIVGQFRNGQEALEYLENNGADLAVVDTICRSWTDWNLSANAMKRISKQM